MVGKSLVFLSEKLVRKTVILGTVVCRVLVDELGQQTVTVSGLSLMMLM